MKRLILSLFVLTTFAFATIINVPADSSTIQGGINGAVNGDTVLVAAGTYIEHDIDLGSKKITLGSLYITTGDTSYISSTIVDANDQGRVFIISDGYQDTTLVLSGFTIQNGNISGGEGAGLYIKNCTPILDHLVIKNNYAANGAGIHISRSNGFKIRNCTIKDNISSGAGGGIRTHRGGNLTSGIIVNSVIKSNYCHQGGGANFVQTTINMNNVDIINNTSTSNGGGLLNYESDGVFDNITVSGNTSSDKGGGIYIHWNNPNNENTLKIRNSFISNNSSENSGSGLFIQQCSPEIFNTLINNNLAAGNNSYNRDIFVWQANSYPSFINCTITNNQSTTNGTLIKVDLSSDSQVKIINSIVYEETQNYSSAIVGVGGGALDIVNSFYNLLDSSDTDISVTVNPASPSFNNPFIDSQNGNYQLDQYSTAIGYGVDSVQIDHEVNGVVVSSDWYYAPTTDIDGNTRPIPAGSNPDIGAYEDSLGTPTYLPQVVNVPTDYSTIQAALTAANATDTVLVQPGTYTENIIWPETNGIKLISAGDSSNTIIDGGGVSSVIYMNPQTATIDTTTLIQGFKITNGGNVNNGGGLFINNASLSISHLLVIDNEANDNCGGIYFPTTPTPGQSVIRNITIMNNTAYNDGGGLCCGNSIEILKNAVIKGNIATNGHGGGIIIAGAINLVNVIIDNNISLSVGGGIYLVGDNANLTSVKISNNITNSFSYGGGGIYIEGSAPTFVDVTINNNSSNNDGGGVYIWSTYNGTIEMDNIYVHDNFAEGVGGGLYLRDSVNLTNSKILKNSAGSSNRGGGGIYISPSGYTNIENTIIAENNAIQGGGLIIKSRNVTLSNVTIINNNATNNGGGIFVSTIATPISILNSLIMTNSINNGGDGIYIGEGDPIITGNNIIGNGIGLHNNDNSNITDATNNFWGDSSGPYHPNQNPTGQGDSTNVFVNVTPWLTTPNTDAPPIPAQNTTVTGTGNDFISLNWDASLIGDLAGYKVYYDSDSSGYPYAYSVNIGTDTSYILSSLTLGTTYYLAVTTYDTDGNESWYSNEVTGTTRVMQAQSLDIGGDEDLQHMVSHTPSITFGYYDSMNETQTSYQVQVSTLSDYSSADMWDSGEVTSSDTSVTYAGTTLADGVTYYVRAKVGAGSFYSNWSTLTFRMNTEPTTPVLVLPINDQVSGTPVVLNVLNGSDAESDAVTYSFNVYSDVTLTAKLDSATAVTEETDTTSWQITATLPDNGQYFWTVSTNDGYEESTVSTAASFLLNISNDEPAAFALLAPVDSAEVTTLTPLLDWASASDPDPIDTVRYTLHFGTMIPDLQMVSVDTVTSYQVSTSLSDNTTYYWKVVAIDLNDASTENTGGYHSFRVNTANDLPGDFALLSPEDSSIVTNLTPTFHWEEPVDPDDRSRSIVSYYVYLDTTSGLTAVIPDTVVENSYTPTSDLLEDAMYYWKVEAVDDDGGVTSSAMWSFWTNSENSAPSAFSLVEPLNNAVLIIFNPPFCWEPATDADIDDQINYVLELGEHIDSLSIIYNGPYMASCFSETMGLVEDNTTYYWKVTAVDLSGATTVNSGGYHSFIINTANDPPIASTLVAPLNGSIQTDLTPNFYWTEAVDPDPLDHVSYTINWWGTGDMGIQSIDTDSNGVTPETILMDNSVWEWMVIANDMHNSQSTSDTSYFYSDAFPEPPLNFVTVSPENNAEGIATEVEFIWEETDDPDPVEEISYRVVYASNWEDSSTYVYSETIEDTSMVITLGDNSQYYWLVEALDSDGFIVGSNNNTSNVIVVGTLAIDGDLIPVEFALRQNYPNPFNPVTTLRYDIPENSHVTITIYDMLGRQVKTLINQTQDAGYRSIIWDATNDYGKPVSAGMYLYQIQAGEYNSTKKMVLLK